MNLSTLWKQRKPGTQSHGSQDTGKAVWGWRVRVDPTPPHPNPFLTGLRAPSPTPLQPSEERPPCTGREEDGVENEETHSTVLMCDPPVEGEEGIEGEEEGLEIVEEDVVLIEEDEECEMEGTVMTPEFFAAHAAEFAFLSIQPPFPFPDVPNSEDPTAADPSPDPNPDPDPDLTEPLKRRRRIQRRRRTLDIRGKAHTRAELACLTQHQKRQLEFLVQQSTADIVKVALELRGGYPNTTGHHANRSTLPLVLHLLNKNKNHAVWLGMQHRRDLQRCRYQMFDRDSYVPRTTSFTLTFPNEESIKRAKRDSPDDSSSMTPSKCEPREEEEEQEQEADYLHASSSKRDPDESAGSILVTPRRDSMTEQSLLIEYLDQWVTTEEMGIILRESLVPQLSSDDGSVHWIHSKDDDSGLLTVIDLAEKVYHEAIEAYPLVFRAQETRKTRLVHVALCHLIHHNPNYKGLPKRRQVVEDMREYFVYTGRQEDNVLPIEMLLEETEKGEVLRFSSMYFPPSRNREPFKDYDSMRFWLERLLERHMKSGHTLPTLEEFKKAYERGVVEGFTDWYSAFYEYIKEHVMGDEQELRLLMSCVASASPNSSISSNVINAIRNYRAISQGTRPRWSSYAWDHLVNFLATPLGRPSGPKVTSFLDNLVHPYDSVSVTIDTHMESFLLGRGRHSFCAHEYSIMEDAYRMACRACGETPSRFQAAIWFNQAGPLSFKQEIVRYERVVPFKLAPSPEIVEEEEAVNDSSVLEFYRCCQARDSSLLSAAEYVLRRKLIDIGYMNRPTAYSYTMEDGEIVPDPDELNISLILLVPMGELSENKIKATIKMRNEKARQQKRSLHPEEEEEIARLKEKLFELAKIPSGTMPESDDLDWFHVDLECIKRWMFQCPDPYTRSPTRELITRAEVDPYHRTHLHFPGRVKTLQSLLEPGGFFVEVCEQLRHHSNAFEGVHVMKNSSEPPDAML